MMILTIHGEMDDSLLEKREGVDTSHPNAHTAWIEYWFNGELVHRSAHVMMKKIPTVTIQGAEVVWDPKTMTVTVKEKPHG